MPINTVSFVLLMVFILDAFLYVLFYTLKKNRIRIILKLFLIPLLLVAVAIENPYLIALMIGLFFDWVGDILIIDKRKKVLFHLSGIAFFIGHSCYLIQLLISIYQSTIYSTVSLHYLWLIIAAVVILITIYCVVSHLFEKGDWRRYFSTTYFSIMAMWVPTSIVLMVYNSPIAILITIGGMSFFVSDGCIYLVDVLKKPFKYRNEFVSITYVIAIWAITFGFLLLK